MINNSPQNSFENNLKCNICYSFYNSDNFPLVLACGHSFCSKCVNKIYKPEEKMIQCAFDKRFLEYNTLEDIPNNYSYLQLLQTISELKISDKCNFLEGNSNSPDGRRGSDALNFTSTVEEFSNCKTILDLKFIQHHAFISQAKEIVYEMKYSQLNGGTIYQKFSENKKFMSIRKIIYDNGEYFEGIYQCNKKHGWGRKRFCSGMCFEGFFNSGSKQGFGIEISKNGDIFIGEFENNFKSGEGVMFYNNNNNYNEKSNLKFEGKFFMNKKHGKGKEVFIDGTSYEGEFVNGMRTGQGLLTFSNGNFLKGEFLNGKLNGDGKEKTEHHRYKGEFREGLKHGYGILVYNNGNMYKGLYLNNKPHGKGVFKYSNGNLYEGEFLEGKKHGKGRFDIACSDSNGNNPNDIFLTYTGEFVNDFFEGKGILITKNKTMYKGEFSKGLKKGFGIITYSNGDEYRGYFERDMKNGNGEIYYSDSNKLVRGIWRNNIIISGEQAMYVIPESELDDISIYY